jgi:hypothetical protein
MKTEMARLGILALCLLAACGQTTTGGDSQTNWLSECTESAECGSLVCVCGHCVEPCPSGACTTSGTTCQAMTSPAAQALCGAPAAAVCLAECDASRACASGQRCVGGACVPGASTPDAGGSSDASAQSDVAVQDAPRRDVVDVIDAPATGDVVDVNDAQADADAAPDGGACFPAIGAHGIDPSPECPCISGPNAVPSPAPKCSVPGTICYYDREIWQCECLTGEWQCAVLLL